MFKYTYVGIPVNSLCGKGSGGNQSDMNITLEASGFSLTFSLLSSNSSILEEFELVSNTDLGSKGFIGIGSKSNQSCTEPVMFKNDSISSSATGFALGLITCIGKYLTIAGNFS